MKPETSPCNFDHNGECLICDCWPKDCAWNRLWAGNFVYESYRQLMVMFKDKLTEEQVKWLDANMKPRHCRSGFCSVSYRMGGCECDCEMCMEAMR